MSGDKFRNLHRSLALAVCLNASFVFHKPLGFLWHIAWEVLCWKKGVYIVQGLSIHTYGAKSGFSQAELGLLCYNILLSVGSSCNGIIIQSNSTNNQLRRKYILGPMICKNKGKEEHMGVTSRGFLKRAGSHCMCITGTCWTMVGWSQCFISSPKTIFSCPLSVYKCSLKSMIFSTYL